MFISYWFLHCLLFALPPCSGGIIPSDKPSELNGSRRLSIAGIFCSFTSSWLVLGTFGVWLGLELGPLGVWLVSS